MDGLTLAVPPAATPLDDPPALPLLPPGTVAAFGPTLVVAPHQDDESLGCGGAIALLADADLPVHVLFTSDGTGSHLDAPSCPPARLRAIREGEALAALARLGLAAADATFLRLPDTAVPGEGHPAFAAAAARVRAALLAHRPATVLAPWRGEYHCDHAASWQLVSAASDGLARPPRLLEYPIWLYDRTMPHRLPEWGAVRGWRLDIGPALPRKLAAIREHRSQLTDLIPDARRAFRLDPAFLAHFARPWEVYLEAR